MSRLMRFLVCIGIIAFGHFAHARKRPPAYSDARLNGATVKVKLHVVDDENVPVADANVRVFMGMNFREKGYWIDGHTDTNGVFIVEGKTCGDEIRFYLSKDGYYCSGKKLCFITMGAEHEVKDGKWLPYGAVEIIQLRPHRNQHAMSAVERFASVAQTNCWLGFDMQVGDFIKPWGRGVVTDFEVMAEYDGKPAMECRLCKATIRFSEPESGFYRVGKVAESDFPYPYRAYDGMRYESFFTVVNREGEFRLTRKFFPAEQVFVTRTRCRLFESEKRLVGATYGIIKRFDIYPSRDGKAVIDYVGAINYDENDTNLEGGK